MKPTHPALCALVFTAVAAGTVAQHIPSPRALSPVGGRRGTEVEVTITGESLDEASGLRFSGPGGVSGEFTAGAKPGVSLSFTGGGIERDTGEGKRRKALIRIDADAQLGEREVRVVSPDGVSEPLKFHVGALAEVRERGANNRREEAQPVELPVTINGRVGAAAEEDFYAFTASKGQRLLFDLFAFRMGSPLDSTLTLYNAAGERVANNEDANGLDSLLDFTVPEDGGYVIGVRDLRYQGGGNYHYRLSAGELPWLDAVFPSGARRGTTADVTFIGRNLGEMTGARLVIAHDAAPGIREVRAETAAGVSNAREFEVSDIGSVVESEPNDSRDQAMVITIPVNIDGRIEKEKDADVYKFSAAPGQRTAFQVRARRSGSPLDAVITITNAEGGVIAANDDLAAGQADAALDFAAYPAAGDYFLTITDVHGRGGAGFIYRINCTTPRTELTGRFFPDNPTVARGGNVNLRVEVEREPGYFGAVEVRAEGLPKGVTARPVLVAADAPGSTWLTLTADEGAEPGAAPFQIVMTAVAGGERLRREARPVIKGEGPPENRYITTNDQFTREAFLTVREAAPFTVEPVSLAAYIHQGTAGGVEGRIRRRAGFEGEVQVALEGYSPGREPISRSLDAPPVKVPAGQERFQLNYTSPAASEPGTRPVMLVASTTHNGRTFTEQSPAFPLTIYEIPFMISNTRTRLSVVALPPGSESAAGEAVYTIKVQRRGLFTGPVTLTPEGVPEGVRAEGGVIAPGTDELTLKLSATDKAPLDKPAQFTILGSGEAGGRRFEHRAPPITLTVTAPEPSGEPAQPEAGPKP